MPRKSQEGEVRREVEEYLAPVLANIETDDRPVSVAAIARVYGRSRQTYYRYGLNERIQAVREERERRQRGGKPKSSSSRKLEEARADAHHWETMYRKTLEKIIILENYLRRHPGIDVDMIYARGMEKPDRSEPR